MTFENQIVNAINKFFEEKIINGIAYRIKQARYTAQTVDILVDSEIGFIAVECKSINTDKDKALYFSQHFQQGKQIEALAEFRVKSTRRMFLCVELRSKKLGNSAYLIPFRLLEDLYNTKYKGLEVDDIKAHPCLERDGRGYKWANIFQNTEHP